MKNSIFSFPLPENERVKSYEKGSVELKLLEEQLEKQSNEIVDIPLIIGGKEYKTKRKGEVRMPHDHHHVLATYSMAEPQHVDMAIEAALEAHKKWEGLSWTVRASILLKAAELLAGKYRPIINAATMLGQSKNIYQAEIDSACEAIDFLRYNVAFASQIYSRQPKSHIGEINSIEYRPLEGFVFTISPFNFTAIASNLNMSPILMGNTTIWKPATTAILSNYYLMKIFQEAGLPSGVINFLPGSGSIIGPKVFSSKDLAGLHFTGSCETFNSLWRQVGENLGNYRAYPRLIGETGGKDFIFVHPSADPHKTADLAFRGAFEYQGQKCSAASRMYVPKSLWRELESELRNYCNNAKIGDVRDPECLINAVIDEKSFDNIVSYIELARSSSDADVIIGGTYDKSKGYFVAPTVILTTNPHFKSMVEEIFGPVLSVYVYEDSQLDEAVKLCEESTPYALTGAIIGEDRVALEKLSYDLRYAAGNFYINDKPTGAVVGMQPFGGSRASGTNDKAGGEFNLIRWTLPRTIKEKLVF